MTDLAPAPSTPAPTIPAPAAPAPTPAPPKAWYDGKVDEETIGYLRNRGLHDKTPDEVAIAAIKSHREAEKFLGAPSTELIRLPKDPNDPAWRSARQKLGVPSDKDGYDFSAVKFSNDEELDADFVTFLKESSHESNLSKQDAVTMARRFVERMEAAEANEAGEKASKLALEKDALTKNWGVNFTANHLVARRAAQALGVTEEQMNTLESVVGYSAVHEMFRQIGSRIGEDKFISSPAGPTGAMTVAQAKERLATLRDDQEWGKKLLSGNAAAKREFDDLTRLIAGV